MSVQQSQQQLLGVSVLEPAIMTVVTLQIPETDLSLTPGIFNPRDFSRAAMLKSAPRWHFGWWDGFGQDGAGGRSWFCGGFGLGEWCISSRKAMCGVISTNLSLFREIGWCWSELWHFFVPETDQSCRQMSGNGADLLHEANVTAFSPWPARVKPRMPMTWF